ncbi:AmmeMemoRadiSam system protein A [uncultured Acetobacteroides sp.]|uniref:AmmeMemoRadiSam system protein A n=1 Tax=uncultured Acetobacteroides sp. TaxID=1760811 RepID=UPI0029F57DFC|nr:AmmeMemoRadiSam system protein A [uncultured Acetobacteroides sp.]
MSTPSTVFAKLAKETIAAAFEGKDPEPSLSHELTVRAACFVSLHTSDGSLRGCIGTLEPRKPSLYEEIKTNALSAAFNDPRFPPVSEEEVEDLEISVDILHKPEPITSESELDPDIYGVIIESGYKRGVLLPNLPSVTTIDEQLRIVRRKAGIFPEERVKLYRFMVDRYY